jgi:Peroxisomal biogenesis factor 11 (PEX11)
MKEIEKALAIWTKLALNVRLRDRSVKVIQYGCQMLMGYYGSRMSEESLKSVKITRRTASTARKAFWLLKWINHIGSIAAMINDNILQKSVPEQLDLLEQVFLVLYYLYENQIFLARCDLFNFNEDDLDLGCNVTWFAGDLAFFFSSGIRLVECYQKRKRIEQKLAEECVIENRKDASGRRRAQLVAELNESSQLLFDLQLSFVIAVLELGVSAHYVYVYRLFNGGKDISEGHVGLMGVASSVLILYEGYLKAIRS